MILFVDDEGREVRDYVDELRFSGYEVLFEEDVDAAMATCDREGHKISLLILDIMMPPGILFEGEDTESGLRTGVSFFNKVRDKFPDLFVFILTNVTDDDVMDVFRNEPNCLFLRKEEYFPLQLVDKVKETLAFSNFLN